MNQGMWWPLEAGKVREMDSSLESTEGMQLCTHHDLKPTDADVGLTFRTLINRCCSKPLSLW